MSMSGSGASTGETVKNERNKKKRRRVDVLDVVMLDSSLSPHDESDDKADYDSSDQ